MDRGAYGADAASTAQSPAAVAVATDPTQYESLWDRFVGHAGAPQIDFAKESVVFLSLGTRRTGGYSIEPTAIAADGEVVVVTATVTTPQPGGAVTMAFTSPYAVVAVDRPNVKRVRWADASGNTVAETR